MVLIAAAGIGLVSFVFLNQQKMMNKLNIANDADKQVENISTEIAAMLINPNHCTANFKGLTFTTSDTDFPVSTFKRCISASCTAAAAGSTDTYFNIGNTNWNVYGYLSAVQPGKVRIKSVKYRMSEQLHGADYNTGSGSGKFAPGILTLTIKYEKNMGLQTNEGGNKIIAQVTRDYVYRTTVVTGKWDTPSPGFNHSATLEGCSRNFSSTKPY